MTKFDISRNANINRNGLAKSFFSLPKSTLTMLSLNYLWWKPFENMFDGLAGSKITKIELSNSYLTPFDGMWFQNLSSLTSLDISWNSIEDNLSLKGLSSLQWINLEGNMINVIPDFCKDGLHNLTSMRLSNTKLYSLDHLRNHTECLTRLKNINLCGISIQKIPNNTFSKLPSLKSLTMCKMASQLTTILPNAFNSSSLTILTFSRADGFRFTQGMAQKGFFEPSSLFKNCPNLIELDLSHNIIQFSSKLIRDMFTPLKKLKLIWLESLYLASMPKYFFYRFPLLEYISLDDNILRSWTDGSKIFDGLTKLHELHLSSNKINMISETSLPPNILKSLRVIDFKYNHFSCTCDIMWFRNWIANTKVNVTDKNNFQCDNLRTKLKDYNPSVVECHILLISLSVSCGVSLIVIITVTVYFCRWRIRFQLYNIRSMKRSYQTLHDKDEFTYVAYVVYCYEDLEWVKNNLLRKIEIEYGYKLCIPHRDFELGKVFADNIVDHMNLSKTVIPVLSNNFARSEWCLFQLAVARNKITKEGNLSIFPIMLDEIEFQHMNSALYSLIKLSSYAAWDEDENAMDLFWDKVKDHLKKVY
jgi:toll-like receptor 13